MRCLSCDINYTSTLYKHVMHPYFSFVPSMDSEDDRESLSGQTHFAL